MPASATPIRLPALRGRVLALLALLMFLAGGFTAMDGVRTWMAATGHVPFLDWPGPLSQLSAVLRMSRSVLCLVLVLQVGPAVRLRARDDHFLTSAMALAVLGDVFLIFREGHPQWFFLAGVGAFLVCHMVLTARHLSGIADDFAKPGVRGGLIGTALAVLALGATVVVSSWSVMKPPIDIPYVAVLSLSLWAAWGAVVRADDADFPRVNRWLIAGGLSLFYACDIALGINARWAAAVGYTELVLWLGMVPDLTYSWDLISLALSGFRWDVLTGE